MARKLGKPIRAAGGVVWRPAPGGKSGEIEVAVIHRPRYGDWSIPKGKLGAGESELDGALREVFEETGHRVRPGRALGEIRYLKDSDSGAREKVVHYWAMQAIGGAFTPSREVDELLWLSTDGARALLTRETDRDVLSRFLAGPALTGMVLLVRHASAGNRADWNGDDRARPLDEQGEEQAQELVRLLSRFEVQEIVSADYLRCLQTVQPLADSIGLEVHAQPLLSEEEFSGNEQRAVETVRELADAGNSVAACTQRVVIPELVSRLAQEDGIEIEEPSSNKKASVWALSFDGRRLCAAEYFPPPSI